MDKNPPAPHAYEYEIIPRNIVGNASSVAVKKKSAISKEVNESVAKYYSEK